MSTFHIMLIMSSGFCHKFYNILEGNDECNLASNTACLNSSLSFFFNTVCAFALTDPRILNVPIFFG